MGEREIGAVSGRVGLYVYCQERIDTVFYFLTKTVVLRGCGGESQIVCLIN